MRPLCVLMLLQGACLAAGLLIHDRFLISTARWSESAGPGVARSSTALPEETARLFAAMPAASALAFVWTIGLQSAIAYFLLARLQGEHLRRQSKSDEQSLHHTRDLLRTRDAVIFGLAKLAEVARSRNRSPLGADLALFDASGGCHFARSEVQPSHHAELCPLDRHQFRAARHRQGGARGFGVAQTGRADFVRAVQDAVARRSGGRVDPRNRTPAGHL